MRTWTRVLDTVEQEGPAVGHLGIDAVVAPDAPDGEPVPRIVLHGPIVYPPHLGQQADRGKDLGRGGRRGGIAPFFSSKKGYCH